MLLVQWGEGKGEKREPVFRADLCVLHAAECNAVGFLTPAPAPVPGEAGADSSHPREPAAGEAPCSQLAVSCLRLRLPSCDRCRPIQSISSSFPQGLRPLSPLTRAKDDTVQMFFICVHVPLPFNAVHERDGILRVSSSVRIDCECLQCTCT